MRKAVFLFISSRLTKGVGDVASGQGGNCPFSKRLRPAEFAVNRVWMSAIVLAVASRMTPEESERFRQRMREHFGFGPSAPKPEEH
jgi:hypothetical protein